MSENGSERIIQADIVRILALFAVVGIHLLNPIYARPDFFGGKFWWICFALNALFRASVPLFVMLSGYLLLGKNTSIQDNVRRTWNRLLIPLIGFYVIVVMYKGFLAWTRMKPYDLWNILHDLTKSSASYLYFLVILAGLYLLIPLLQKVFDRTAKDDVLPKYLIGFFVANALLATLARYTSLRVGEVLSNTFTIWLPWVGYFLLGYWIREHLDALRKHTKKFFLAFSLAFFCTLFFGFLSWRMHWAGNEQWYMSGMTYPEEYLSVNVMVMSVSAFVLLMTVRIPEKVRQNQQLVRGLALLAELSFGVYLIHVLVIDILNNFFGITADNPAMPNLPTYVLINTALTVSISLALAWAARRIPLLQRLVGVVPKKA